MEETADERRGRVAGTKNTPVTPHSGCQTVMKSFVIGVVCNKEVLLARRPSAIQILKSCWIQLPEKYSLPWRSKKQRAGNQTKAVWEGPLGGHLTVAAGYGSGPKTTLTALHLMGLLMLHTTQKPRPTPSHSVMWTSLINTKWQDQIINSSPGV